MYVCNKASFDWNIKRPSHKIQRTEVSEVYQLNSLDRDFYNYSPTSSFVVTGWRSSHYVGVWLAGRCGQARK